jgi:hypothetical protein
MPITESTVMADEKKKRGGAKPKVQAVQAPASVRQVTIRHYCQGIGDCHLLGFDKPDGGTYWMLIDCGIHGGVQGGSKTMNDVLTDIAAVTDHIDVVVVTHEHMDHVSAFPAAAGRFKSVGEIWMGWTENPADPQAIELDRFKANALNALDKASKELQKLQPLDAGLNALASGLTALDGFHFDLAGQKVRSARNAVFSIVQNSPPVHYREPGQAPITIPDLPGLRIFVLGPPRDPKLLGINVRRGEMYGAAADGWPIAQALSGAFAAATGIADEKAQAHMPFEPNVGADIRAITEGVETEDEDHLTAFVREFYHGRPDKVGEHDWRKIEHDWLGASADLAMQLDSKTNNTSLVLAFEFVDTGRVLLFAADAQVGSWLSWHDLKWTVGDKTITGPDLLARTVYYKVSHHCSSNATLRQKGLDMMTHQDLSAFIPTNKEDANKIGWHEMPFDLILEALADRCSSRVIRADDEWLKNRHSKRNFNVPSGSIVGLCHDPKGLWVEVKIA